MFVKVKIIISKMQGYIKLIEKHIKHSFINLK